MHELEQSLRELLTDERLDIPLRRGAVTAVHAGVRRRRQRRLALAAASATGVVAFGIGTAVATGGLGDRQSVVPGGDDQSPSTSSSPTEPPSPRPAPSGAARVAWSGDVYDSTSVVIPGTVPDPAVPWCDAAQLSVTGAFQGSGGGLLGQLSIRNSGGTCGLQGVPAVTGFDTKNRSVALARPADTFLVHPWVEVGPDGRAQITVEVSALAARCGATIDRFELDLGHGGAPVSVPALQDGTGRRGLAVPHCGGGTDDQYAVDAGAWQGRGVTTLPWAGVEAHLHAAPQTVMQGDVLHYRVELDPSGSSPLTPCLPFRESLLSLGATQQVLASGSYLLNCKAMAPGSPAYDMDVELAVPTSAPAGPATIVWQTPIPGLEASGVSIQILAAPPACREQQLSVAPGRQAAAGGTFEQLVVFTNASASACSLHGWPGLQFIDDQRQPLRTRPVHTGSFGAPFAELSTVVLAAHGGVASFGYWGPDVGRKAGGCPTATAVKVIAPNLVQQRLVAASSPYCRRGTINVSMVAAGRRGPR